MLALQPIQTSGIGMFSSRFIKAHGPQAGSEAADITSRHSKDNKIIHSTFSLFRQAAMPTY